MKRINPDTNTYFKDGDVRKDGYIFHQYKLNKIKKDGFFTESWISPSAHEKYRKSNVIGNAKRYATPEGRATKLIQQARLRTKNTSIKFNLSVKDILPTLLNGKCELTELNFDFNRPKKGYHNPYAPSLDRINPKKGYVKSNIRIVLVAVNQALNEYGEEKTLPILEAMVKGIKKNVKKRTVAQLSETNNRKG